jgi:2,3-diketo-5-methylthio-1-phosphopentane phosphatase
MLNKMGNTIVFCDFDGTITEEDCIDKLLSLYADDKWENIEEDWKNGLIGSKDCLEQQIKCITDISSIQLNEFIKNIKIDKYFHEFISQIKENNIEFHIVSDGFSLFINDILTNNNIFDVSSFSNYLELANNKLIATFPNSNNNCSSQSGTCKCSVINTMNNNKFKIYIGDGRSDICAIKHADLIFAKEGLAKYCMENSIKYVEYDNFKDILVNLSTKEREYDTCGIN